MQRHFAPLMRIFSHYSEGRLGHRLGADALEMELEEFHDFVKDAKLETKLVRFDAMCVVFAKANATNTAEAYEQRKRARRDKVVQAGLEAKAAPPRPRRSARPRTSWAQWRPSTTASSRRPTRDSRSPTTG